MNIDLSNNIFSSFIENDNERIQIAIKKMLLIYYKSLKRIKYKYFYKYYYIIIKLNIQHFKILNFTLNNGNKRHNKLFNDYKTKQNLLNELQQRYLLKEGKKCTFFPIINNYIIKYKVPYISCAESREMFYDEPPLISKYYNNINNFYKNKKLETIFHNLNIPYNNINNENSNDYQKTLKRKNICLTYNNKNNIYKKVDNNKLSKINRNYQKMHYDNNNYSNYFENEKRTNTYGTLKMFKELSKNLKMLDNQNNNYSEQSKVIQKTNSIKTIISNNSHIIKTSNTSKSRHTSNIKNRSKNKNQEINNLIKVKIPNQNSNYNSNISTNRHLKDEIQSNNYPKKKYKIKKNNNYYNNYYNYKTHIDIKNDISLKQLILEEKSKNRSKPKKYTNMSKHFANKIIDNIFNISNYNYKNINKTTNNSLIITTDELNININEKINSNNIKKRSQNYKDPKIGAFPLFPNKKLKNEFNNKNKNNININKNINSNKEYNLINPKEYNENHIFNNNSLSTVTLIEKQSIQNKKYYNNKYKKNEKIHKKNDKKNCSNNLREKDLDIVNDYFSNYNNFQKSHDKINFMQINQKKIKNIKENNIPLPIPSYNKALLNNKITETKKGQKNKIINELNNKIYNLNNNKCINNLNKNNNHIDIKTKENNLDSIINNNSPFIEDKKIIFSLKKKKTVNNNIVNDNKENIYINKNQNINIEYNANLPNSNNEKIKRIECFKYKGKLNDKNIYKISNNEINEFYSKEKNNKGNNYKKIDFEDRSDLSFQSLSDSKVLEIANTYIEDQVDKSQVSGILTYKKKQNQYSYYEK